MLSLASYAQNVVQGFAVLNIIGQLIAVVALAAFVLKEGRLSKWFSKNALWLMLITSGLATVGSLYFSDIAGWAPCKLCWFQRIFMYPQVLLLALALWKRDRTVAMYIFAMSIIGALFAAMHYYEQVDLALNPPAADELVPCDSTGVSCARTTIHFRFGYITLPMMALTVFILNALGSLFVLKRKG